MIMEIIKISSAIILGFIALGLVVFLLSLVWWIINGFIQGVREGLRDLPKIIEEKKAEKIRRKLDNKNYYK
jgi:hypothetical protein